MTVGEPRVRVLHVLPWVSSGGVERRRLELARGLDPQRFEQRIVCLQQLALRDEFAATNVPVLAVGGSGRVSDVACVRAVAGIAKAYRPDIIHGAVFEGATLAATAGRLARVPIVIVEETSGGVDRSWRGRALMALWGASATRVVAVSDFVAAHLREHGFIAASNISTIKNGVSPPLVPTAEQVARARAAWNLPQDDFVVTSVGRLYDGVKRFTDLIAAVELLAAELPRLRLLLVGDGPDRASIVACAERRGVRERVVMAGYQAQVGLPLALSDVFALVSERESFGLALVEAMHAGLPCIATRVGGLREILVDRQTGLFVPPGRPEAIAAAIRELYASAELRAQMGAAGRSRAGQQLGSERYVAEVAALYEGLLALRGYAGSR